MPDDQESRELSAFLVSPVADLPLVPGFSQRAWIDNLVSSFAYRCLPITIANQHGWYILSNQTLRVTWNGNDNHSGISLEIVKHWDRRCWATSIFGYGIISWTFPYLFRTPPGYDLLVRGPSNWPKDGVQALEGLVETDWSYSTFTMNWKLTRPFHPVIFEVGEPICMIVPVRKNDLDTMKPVIRPIEHEPDLPENYNQWLVSRNEFKKRMETEAWKLPPAETWQKDYYQGLNPDGSKHPGHRTKRNLSKFAVDQLIVDRQHLASDHTKWTKNINDATPAPDTSVDDGPV